MTLNILRLLLEVALSGEELDIEECSIDEEDDDDDAMASSSSSSSSPDLARLAHLLNPALEKIIKNAAWRKHSKLVQECKSVIDKLSAPNPSSSSSGNAETLDPKLPFKAPESPLFDGSRYYFSADEAIFILQPLVTACETGSLKVVEPALDAVQKLISHGFLRGEVDSANAVDNGILVQIMEAVCKCHDLADESIELLVLKTLLTSVTSVFLRVHGDSLLKAVRTCYNIYLGSKVVVNQTTAKASLIQMLVIVFRRMEADSSTIPVQAIVFTDLMEPSERSSSDSNVTQFVQNFITKVVQDIEVILSPPSSIKSIAHNGAFDVIASENTDPTNYLESTDKDMLDAKHWEISMYKNVLDERKGELSELDLDRYGDMEKHITNKLRRDAFLVFRALCKLSMKVSPQEGTDPASLRGKIIALELLKILLENAGEIFRKNERYFVEIRYFLLKT